MIQGSPMDVLEQALSSYKNTKDKDIEDFLQKKAILYEKRGWCSTYCLVNNALLEKR